MDADHLTIALADRYAIEEKIDSGGTATVFRARDLRHDRTVAIKVLKPDLSEAIGADRFLREIRTTANLSHPHILPLHDSGEADGFLFYVMPFVEEGSLRDRMDREDQLPVEDAVQVAREVSDALAYAHEKGVVHRDIKPANIMLERGHALLADFGIAQARAEAEETRLTGHGMSVGTPSYMSPEQAAGKEELDGRSDQYALACVLFEMLAGHPPFTGTGVDTILRQHIATDPPSVTDIRPSVPRGVSKTLKRALAKTPADRFRTMAEFEKAVAGATLPLLARIPMGRSRAVGFAVGAVVLLLGGWAVASKLMAPRASGNLTMEEGWQPDPRRIAVAPFENRTGDPTLDALALSLGYEIPLTLGRMEVGEVLPAHRIETTLQDAGPGADPFSVLSQQLGAGIVVQGQITLAGDSLKIRAFCLDAGTGTEIFPLDAVGSLRTDEAGAAVQIRDRVAALLAQHLDPVGGMGPNVLAPPIKLGAYEEYRRAWDIERVGGPRDSVFAHFRRAQEIDTTYMAPLLDLMGLLATSRSPARQAQFESLWSFLDARRTHLTRHQRRFLDLNRLVQDWEWETAFQEALVLAADWPLETAQGLSWSAFVTNRPEKAAEVAGWLDKGNGEFLEPFVRDWQGYWSHYSYVLHLIGRHEKELEIAREWRRRFPSQPLYPMKSEASALIGLGRIEEVGPIVDRFRAEGWLSHLWNIADKMWVHGHRETARQLLEEEVARFDTDSSYIGRFNNQAMVLHRLGRDEEAHDLWEAGINPDRENPFVPGIARLGFSAGLVGDTAQAREMDERLQELPALGDLAIPMYRAQIAAALGEKDRAVRILEEWSRGPRPQFWVLSLNTDFTIRSLLGDHPGFQELIRPKG